MEAIKGIEIIDAVDSIAGNASSVTLGNGFFTSNGSSSIIYDGNDTTDNDADNKLDLSSQVMVLLLSMVMMHRLLLLIHS